MKWLLFFIVISRLAEAGFAPQEYESNSSIGCEALPSKWPTWSSFPRQATLPDPFQPPSAIISSSGARIQSREEWMECQRPQLLAMLQEYQFGYYPDHSQETVTATRSGNSISITVAAGGKSGRFSATLSLPSGQGPFPVVINIGGMDNNPYLQKGIAIVGFNYGDVAPDSNAKTGAFWSLYNGRDIGVLTAWAWGFHRVIDALDLVAPEIDTSKVGATGCSRLGKGALAAGLFSERITLTMPMSSGVQGAGPYRYYTLSGQGENLDNSKQGAPWWTNSRLAEFVGHHENLPYDAHAIVAAIAPRAVIMDQGTSDPFVNSKGTSVTIFPAARQVYNWLGADDRIALALRSGGHCDMSGYSNVLPYVEYVLKGVPLNRDYHSFGPYGSAMSESFPWASKSPPQSGSKDTA